MLRDKVDVALQQMEPAYVEVRRLAAEANNDTGDASLMADIAGARNSLRDAARKISAALHVAPAAPPTSEEKEDKHGITTRL